MGAFPLSRISGEPHLLARTDRDKGLPVCQSLMASWSHVWLVVDQPATESVQNQGHVVRYARTVTFQLAEVAVTVLVMRATAIQLQTGPRRRDRSARRAEKRHRRADAQKLHDSTCPIPVFCAPTDTAQGRNRLFSNQTRANVTSDGGVLGECRLETRCCHWKRSLGYQPASGHSGHA